MLFREEQKHIACADGILSLELIPQLITPSQLRFTPIAFVFYNIYQQSRSACCRLEEWAVSLGTARPPLASGVLLFSLKTDLSAEVKAFIPAGDRVERNGQAWG